MLVRLAFFPGATRANFDRLAAELAGAPEPAARVLFAAGPVEGGWQVVQVWESREDLEAWNAAHFVPALRRIGPAAFPAPPQVSDVLPELVSRR